MHRLPTLAALLLLGSCGGGGVPGAAGSGASEGARLYAALCAQCHGKDGRGTMLNMGPSYAGIAQHWTQESLLRYLDDPAAYAKSDPRLGARPMPALPPNLSAAEREALVEHTLSLMD